MGNEYNKIKAKNNMEVGKNADVDTTSETGERPKLQSVVGRAPKKVKRSLLSRLITGVVGPDGVSGIGGYVTEEIVKPAVKNILFDAVTSSISMMLFGDRGMPNRGRSYGMDHRPRTPYNNAYPQRQSNDRHYGRDIQPPPQVDSRSSAAPRSSSRYGVEDYLIADRHDAAHVLTALTEYADRYGLVSIADYYDLIKVDANFTDNNYGWKHDTIGTARIVPVQGGYIIKFPNPEILQ